MGVAKKFKISSVFFSIFFAALVFLFSGSTANAQCSGNLVCGSRLDEVCTLPTGVTCPKNSSPDCTCVYECNGIGTSTTCSAYSPPAACSASSICEVYVGVCTKSGSCSYTPPPPTGPTCGNGTCEAGESAASCPADCSSGGSCSGSCFGGIANCGVVGQVPASGTCSTPGDLCCQDSGGGAACTISFSSSWDAVQGTPKTVYAHVAGALPGWRGELMWKSMYANTTSLGSFSPNPETTTPHYYTFNPTTVGTSTIRLREYSDWVNWDTGTWQCEGYKSVRVYPRPAGTPPTANINVNYSEVPITVPVGTTVRLRWASFAPPGDPPTCVAKGDWSGTKSTPTGSEDVVINNPSSFTIECTNSAGTTSDTVNVFIPGPMSCGLWSTEPSPITVEQGRSVTIDVDNLIENNGLISYVDFVSLDTSVFTVDAPSRDLTKPFSVSVTGVGLGWKRLEYTGTMTDGTQCTNGDDIRVIRWVCGLATPYDPPTPICESTPGASDGSVTWEWDAVPDATEYAVSIVDTSSGAVINPGDNGFKLSINFGATCAAGGRCRYTTSNMPAGSYRSEIIARGACDESGTAVSNPVIVPVCADCNISIAPSPVNAVVGNPPSLVTINTNSIQGGSITQVNWSTANPARATVSPATDTSSPFTTNVTGVTIGNTTITARAYMNGDLTAPVCSDTQPVTASAPDPWWQVLEGTVVTNGAIRSEIPGSCVLPGCIDYFIATYPGGYPGIAAYGTSADFASGPSTGNVSARGWNSNTLYAGGQYSYAYFYNLASGKNINNIAGVLNNAALAGAATDPDGYTWLHAVGDVAVNSNLNINRKVVLFVENGNFNINARISLANPDNDFFMVIAGEDASGNKGDIIINPSVSGVGINPALEGLYFADGSVRTGAGNTQLLVRGAVASYGGIILERDLNNNNVSSPAEGFIYAPEIYLNYPTALSTKHLVWQETSP